MCESSDLLPFRGRPLLGSVTISDFLIGCVRISTPSTASNRCLLTAMQRKPSSPQASSEPRSMHGEPQTACARSKEFEKEPNTPGTFRLVGFESSAQATFLQ